MNFPNKNQVSAPSAPAAARNRPGSARAILALVGVCIACIAAWFATGDPVQSWFLRRKSIPELEKMVQDDPRAALPLYALGTQYARQSRFNEAIRLLERARDADPASFDIRFTLGKAYLYANRLPEALTELEAVRDRAPADARVYQYLGMAERQIGDQNSAKASERRATQLDPKNAEAWYQWGICFTNAYEEKDGIAHLKRAVELRPNDPIYQFAYGRALADTFEFKAAVPYLRFASHGLPDNTIAHFLLGLSLHRSGKVDQERAEAETELRQAIAQNPKASDAHYELGLMEEENGNSKEALHEFEIAVALDPAYEDIYYHLSRAADRTGHPEQANQARERYAILRRQRQELEALIAHLGAHPEDLAARLHAGELMEQKQSWKAAAVQYVAVLQAQPENKAAAAGLERAKAAMQHPREVPTKARP